MSHCFLDVGASESRNLRQASYSAVAYLLGHALIEIRAASDLDHARILADIFHNVPALVANGAHPEKIEAEILAKADRHGYAAKISAMIAHAKKRTMVAEMLPDGSAS